MSRAGVVSAWSAALAVLAAGAQSPTARAVQPATACHAAVAQQLRDWGGTAPARPQPPGADGAVVRHWPTHTLGVWIVEAVRDDATRLTRVSPATVTDITWSGRCTPSAQDRARPAALAPRFTDADLASLLATHPRGVVYVWSPHMPLSLDAVDAVRHAAAARDTHVTVLLAPDADRRFAHTTLAGRDAGPDALRVVDAVELVFRDVLVHAPAVIAYARGRLRGSPWPGAHSREEYAAYLDRVLAAP